MTRDFRLGVGLFGLMLSAIIAPGTQAQTPVKFTLDWRYEGPAAPFTVALDNGYFKAEGLDVTIDNSQAKDQSLLRVALGAYDIGTLDVNSLIRFRDENPNPKVALKAVMMIYDAPPFAVVGRKSKGVTGDPKSLVGKKFGAPLAVGDYGWSIHRAPEDDLAYEQWPIFKAVNQLDDKTMTFENVGSPMDELASGKVDAVFGYSFSAYLNLKSLGVPADDISVILMSDHGVDLYGNVLIVSPKFLAEKPEAVKGFVKAVIKGMRDTVADPAAAAFTIEKREYMGKQAEEQECLELALAQNMLTPWVKANGYGGIDKARFARSIDQLGLTFKFKKKPEVDDIFTDAFLPPPAERKVQ